MTRASRGRRPIAGEGGFTLIELLVTIVVLGIIMAPLSAVLLTYLKNTDATTARMSESHDAQIAASYFAQDVQAVGVRGPYTSPEPGFVQSVETGATAGGGLYPCGATGTPDAVVRFAWDDYTGTSLTSRTQWRVGYVVDGSELRRVQCDGAGVVSDIRIAHNLVAPFAVVNCADASGSAMSCTGATVPETVSMTLTIQDPDSGSDAPYEVTLTGQRRQT